MPCLHVCVPVIVAVSSTKCIEKNGVPECLLSSFEFTYKNSAHVWGIMTVFIHCCVENNNNNNIQTAKFNGLTENAGHEIAGYQIDGPSDRA